MSAPQIVHLLKPEALDSEPSPYGSVGTVFSGEGIEAVWVSKQHEAIDTDWFSQPIVDLIVVLQGQLRVEFEQPDLAAQILEPGDMLVLPANNRCRAYRWPREQQAATIFLAVYPLARQYESVADVTTSSPAPRD